MRPARLAVAVLVSLVPLARADAASPIPWTAAGDHVRRLVTVEGVVARAATTADRHCVLEFDPNDPGALRVVLIIPLITDLPTDPSRLYQGKRVQVTGRVARFQGRLEMVVTPPQLEVVGLTAPRAASPALAPPVAAAAAAAAPPLTPAASSARPTSDAPAVPAAPSTLATPLAPPDPRCRTWRDDGGALRVELRALTRRLDECLAADRAGCAALGDGLGPPLSRLEAVEAKLDRYCP